MNKYADHPVAALFPMMSSEELALLVESMTATGFDPDHKIKLYEGKILDGRNRYKAALKAGVEPLFEDYVGDDPYGYSCRENLSRRHLSKQRRVAIMLKLIELQQLKLPLQQVADQAEVSLDTVKQVSALKKKDPEKFEALRNGDATLKTKLKSVPGTLSSNKPDDLGPKFVFLFTDEADRTLYQDCLLASLRSGDSIKDVLPELFRWTLRAFAKAGTIEQFIGEIEKSQD